MQWKSIQWEPSGSMRMDWRIDRQADMPMLIVPFHNFANVPKCCFLNKNIYHTENMQCGNTGCHGNQGVTHSHTNIHASITN